MQKRLLVRKYRSCRMLYVGTQSTDDIKIMRHQNFEIIQLIVNATRL